MVIRRLIAILAMIGLMLAMAIPVSANSDHHDHSDYAVHVLVTGPSPDTDLVNGWGISRLPGSPWWVADNGTDQSTIYKADGTKQGLKVAIPFGEPTGTVSNTDAGDFHGDAFLFDSEAGVISGWRGALGTTAEVGNNDHQGDAVYKGLAIGTADVGNGMATYLYATDFHNGRIDVFDSTFASQTWSGAFVDPKLPKGYAPFGIQNLKGLLFVTYAKTTPGSNDEVDGKGLGVVDVFLTDGTFFARVAKGDGLNAPWGMAWAPADFGPLQRRPHRRQLRRRQTPRLCMEWQPLAFRRRADRRAPQGAVDRRPVGHRLRRRDRQQRPEEHALLRRRSERRKRWCLRHDRRDALTIVGVERAGPARSAPPSSASAGRKRGRLLSRRGRESTNVLDVG